MDICIYLVKNNKCPCCGEIGSLWDSKRDIINNYGRATQVVINTYECSNKHEQTLFATKTMTYLGDFNSMKNKLDFYR